MSLTVLLLASTLSADNSHRQEAKQQLALRAAAREVLDELQQLAEINEADSAILGEELKKAMLKNVERHRVPKQSLEIARTLVKENRANKAMDWIDNAAAKANELSPIPVTRDQLVERLGDDWAKQRDAILNTFIGTHLEKIFSAARSNAILVQKARIEQSLRYPEFEELDSRLIKEAGAAPATPLTGTAFSRLQPWLQSTISADQVTFEENQPVLKSLAEGVVSKIQSQYDRQMATLRKILETESVPADCITRVPIEAFLAHELGESVRSMTTVNGVPAYEPFTVVKQFAASQAIEIEKERLLAFIAQPESVQIDRSDVEECIEKEPAKHRDPGQSQRHLVDWYVDRLHLPLAEKYAARSKTPVVNQIDLLLLGDNPVSAAFRTRIDNELKKILPSIRADLSQRQFEDTFPALSRNEPFTEPMIEFLHDGQTPKIKNMALLTQLLAIDTAHTPRKYNPAELFIETETLALEKANVEATPLLESLGAQLRLLAAMEKEELDQLRNDVADGKPFEKIKKIWTDLMNKRWQPQSKEFPEQARAIFKRTENQLDKTVRQLYNALEAEEATRQQQSTPASVDAEKEASFESERVEVPEEQEEKEEEEEVESEPAGMEEELLAYKGSADFVMILSDAPDNKCRMVFGRPSAGTVQSTDFLPSETEKAAEKIADEIKEEFRELLRSKVKSSQGVTLFFWRKRSPRVRVLVLEHSRQTRHITTILLQTRIKELIQEWTKAGKIQFEFDWQESLGIAD